MRSLITFLIGRDRHCPAQCTVRRKGAFHVHRYQTSKQPFPTLKRIRQNCSSNCARVLWCRQVPGGRHSQSCKKSCGCWHSCWVWGEIWEISSREVQDHCKGFSEWADREPWQPGCKESCQKGALGCKEWACAPSGGAGRTAQWGKQPAEHSQEQDCADQLHLSFLKLPNMLRPSCRTRALTTSSTMQHNWSLSSELQSPTGLPGLEVTLMPWQPTRAELCEQEIRALILHDSSWILTKTTWCPGLSLTTTANGPSPGCGICKNSKAEMRQDSKSKHGFIQSSVQPGFKHLLLPQLASTHYRRKNNKSLTFFQGPKQGLSGLVANIMPIFPEFGSAAQTDVLKALAAPETNLEANSDIWTFSMCPQCWILTLSH